MTTPAVEGTRRLHDLDDIAAAGAAAVAGWKLSDQQAERLAALVAHTPSPRPASEPAETAAA